MASHSGPSGGDLFQMFVMTSHRAAADGVQPPESAYGEGTGRQWVALAITGGNCSFSWRVDSSSKGVSNEKASSRNSDEPFFHCCCFGGCRRQGFQASRNGRSRNQPSDSVLDLDISSTGPRGCIYLDRFLSNGQSALRFSSGAIAEQMVAPVNNMRSMSVVFGMNIDRRPQIQPLHMKKKPSRSCAIHPRRKNCDCLDRGDFAQMSKNFCNTARLLHAHKRWIMPHPASLCLTARPDQNSGGAAQIKNRRRR